MTLERALLILWALALATTALTLAGGRAPEALIAALVLALGWLKGRAILKHYLETDAAPGWRAALLGLLAALLALCWLLALIPAVTAG